MSDSDREQHSTAEYIDAVREHEPAGTTEIADAVGVARQSADYRLRQLEDQGLVTSKKIGNSLAWSLVEDAIDAPHEQAFQAFADRLTDACGEAIHEIILYGSVARGEAREHSDVDVLIIIEDESERDVVHDESVSIAFDVMIEYGASVSKNIKTKAAFENQKDSSYLTAVRREGRAYAR
jgi:DNA-binding transcriptional ArsR family regulator